MNKKKGLVTGIISAVLLIALLLYNGFNVNPHDLKVREETIVSSKIDDGLDGTLIAYFCDLHYGHNIKEEDLDKLVEKINAFDPDIIIFGGDLLSNDEDIDTGYLLNKLKELDARYGKYTVLGDEDHLNGMSESILKEANFTMLTNTNGKIYIDGSFINLLGVDSLINGDPDIESAYEGVNPSYYTFVISHCPDFAEQLHADKSDYILSGHSLGGPVYIPVINYFYRPEGADEYYRGKHYLSGTVLDISNGVGTINKDIRMFADAEIVLYKLKAD